MYNVHLYDLLTWAIICNALELDTSLFLNISFFSYYNDQTLTFIFIGKCLEFCTAITMFL